MSFSYGDLASGMIGELGSGNGLRVCWRTHDLQRIEVWYGTSLLHTSSPPPGHSLRTEGFADVLVQYGSAGLVVTHHGLVHVTGLGIDGWHPMEGWRFAIGARTGSKSDDHHIDDLVLEAGSASEREASPLSVSLNGLQFSSSLPFVYNRETALEAGAGAESGGAGAVSW